MKEEIVNIRTQAVAQIMRADSAAELEEIRVSYLGRKGKLSQLIKKVSTLPVDQIKITGTLINQTKNIILKELSTKSNNLKNKDKWFDPTVPGIKPALGHLHLITQAIEEIANIFEGIGFVRVRYPEVEWDWYAFGSLNFDELHPARDEWETFWINTKTHPKFGPMLLTPHTSSGQIREMMRINPAEAGPIRMINIAKCYRRQSDSTHFPMFHQFEGLVIDQGINITHLKGTIDYFARQFYGESAVSRIRPYNFPFTEPSFEVDFSCVHCGGQSCKFCNSGWHETGGAGMVHPEVLRNGGIDPKNYTGFAFGWGVERTLLLKPDLGIDDIRTLYKTNLNYLKQF